MAFKIYTRTGDDGTTALANGKRISKSNELVDIYGTIDELNSHIGLVREVLLSEKFTDENNFVSLLEKVQNDLFSLGSEVSGSLNHKVITNESVRFLEKEIDLLSQGLPSLKNFILPGGSIASAKLHICRTICRRCERNIINASTRHKFRRELVCYFNRLSDWLFTASRYITQKKTSDEILWNNKKQR